MFRHPPRSGRPALLGAALVFMLTAAPSELSAQDADFLFKRPAVTVGFNAGWAAPREGGDVFADTRRFFTVDEGAFDGLALSGELAYRVTERFDVGVELGWMEAKVASEDREFIGTDDLPIVQTTTLRRTPLTLNVKGYLFERGRSVSRFAWVPATWSPWVGVGAGLMGYRFEQEGEFVDHETLDIFYDKLVDEGTTGTFHVMGGADVSLSPRFLLTGQLRYSWAGAEPDQAVFQLYDEIDLAGFQATAGIKLRL